MRFVHSLSTKPMMIQMYDKNAFERLLGNICYYATSLAYLKKLNQTVVLHTDSLGAALLGFLPYDEIHLTADDIPEELHPRFWAAAKMYALEKEPIGSIHIDGDVFIKTPECLELIEKANGDVIVQNYEQADWYRGAAQFFWKDKEYCEKQGLVLDNIGGYNTGVLGFKNEELKNRFINGYKNIVSHFSKLCPNKLTLDLNCTPDLIAELQYIYQLSEDYKTDLLLTPSRKAKDIGFQHVMTMHKFTCLDKCILVLKKLSPEIYEKTYKLCRNILNKLKLKRTDRQ